VESDPIGIQDELDTSAYVHSVPLSEVDYEQSSRDYSPTIGRYVESDWARCLAEHVRVYVLRANAVRGPYRVGCLSRPGQ
jgi:hypothetical protein